MKIRNSFVSNSSSSSFLLAVKGYVSGDDLIEAFKVPRDSPMYEMTKEVVNVLTKADFEYSDEETYIKEYLLDDQCYDSDYSEEDLRDEERKTLDLLRKGFSVKIGSACDEDGGIEAALCDMDIDYESDTLVIKKEGGY